LPCSLPIGRRARHRDAFYDFINFPFVAMRTMKIVTVASRRKFAVKFLQFRTAGAFEFVVLRPDGPWRNFQPKLTCVHHFSKTELEAGRGDEPFLFVDAFDVIVANLDPQYYRSLYRGKPLFAAEMYSWPDKTLAYPEENLRHKQPYLNSGCFIATPRDMHDLLTENEFRHYTDDQLYWSHVYVKNPAVIDLDFDSRLCACLVAYSRVARALKKKGDDLVFLDAFANPAVLHFNGPALIKKRMWRWYLYCIIQDIKVCRKQRWRKIC
jgi:hypothetical protein